AANGSGAVHLSRQGPSTVLNIDMGGGTTKFARVHDGHVLETAAMSVGGRLVATDEDDRIIRIEPAARTVGETLGIDLQLGQLLTDDQRDALAQRFADCMFEMTRPAPLSQLAQDLLVTPELSTRQPVDAVVFSGGVSEYVYQREMRNFGDLALPLAQSVRDRTAELPGPVQQPQEGIRATVMGASQFTVQVSGNTISISDESVLPMRNVPVLYPVLAENEEVDAVELRDAIQRAFHRFDMEEGEQEVALAIGWRGTPRYQLLRALAEGICMGLPKTIANGMNIIIVFTHDFGKLVGEIIRNDMGISNQVVSIDSIHLRELDFIDIGEIIYPAQAVPVVVKSLVFPEVHGPVAEMAAGQ
ncbi:MAG: ethanolamine ammonia-lyase reactivating factor EutA, partial [Chloroflexota bacterium]